MLASASEWDARYRAAADEPLAEPSGFVRELLPLLPVGAALDLACGTGRHTLLLAARRQTVTAVDASAVALGILERRAQGSHLGISRIERAAQIGQRQHGIQIWQADLERVSLPPQAFSLVLCVNYLQRSLFPQMEGALLPGGILLFETYTVAQLEFAGGPRNPEYLLESGELRTAFPGLGTLFYRELRAEKGIASLLAQKRR
ncbi:MAG TPA: class I SAM-dependent methyltransferase [Candidatus Acidoferrum sp.]|nr:class I SAM-dependent methyltransferase [Candidatus Acidoferrum sp.]